MTTTSKLPGAEFLGRRLARAAAVPPAERSCYAAAFMEAMQLTNEIVRLLPLAHDGRPALPDTPATRRKVGRPALTSSCNLFPLHTVGHCAWPTTAPSHCPAPTPPCSCCWRCPGLPAPTTAAPMLHRPMTRRNTTSIPTCVPHRRRLPRLDTRLKGHRELAKVLWQYSAACALGLSVEAVRQLRAIPQSLAVPAIRRMLQRQMEAVNGSEGRQEALLTAERLQHCNCAMAIRFASKMEQPPSAEEVAELEAAAFSSAQMLLQLAPDNPKSHIRAADAVQLACKASLNLTDGVQGYLRGFQLAQQQG